MSNLVGFFFFYYFPNNLSRLGKEQLHSTLTCSPLPWVLASMISLMRPEPTLFLAASLTLYHVPQRRLSSLNERSVELMNTSLHSSVLSTEYCSTNPAEADRFHQTTADWKRTSDEHQGAAVSYDCQKSENLHYFSTFFKSEICFIVSNNCWKMPVQSGRGFENTSNGASSVVSRNPSQGDGGGGSGGYSQSRLIRRNWIQKEVVKNTSIYYNFCFSFNNQPLPTYLEPPDSL